MEKLTPAERNFFSLVHQAVHANPFSTDRGMVDLEIAGFSGASRDRGFEETIAQVRKYTHKLEDRGRAVIGRYAEEDREILTSSLLFDLFHRYADRFDRLIANQLNSDDHSLPVPFANSFLDRLDHWGVGHEMAKRFLAMCFQLRRAFYFIDTSLKGRSASMRRLRESLWNNVFTHDMDLYHRFLWNRMEDFSTMLLGATGTGKGTAAMAIGRSGFIPFDEKRGCFKESFTRTFISLILSQYSEALIESELFGHRKGAFTGAVEDYDGIFDRCSPYGAILLDEIGEVSAPIQIKLLRVIQERVFNRVGDHRQRSFRGRVIAATNLAAEKLIEGKAMRPDFFYRLCSDLIIVPSLAQRIREDPGELDDILRVVIHRIVGTPSEQLVNWVKRQILRTPGIEYAWPGNVRELEQCTRRILMKREYTPLTRNLPVDLTEKLQLAMARQDIGVAELVAGYCFALHQANGTIEAVARITGLDRRTAKKHIEAGRRRFPRDIA